MKTRTPGTQGLKVSALCLGCMGMSWAYGSSDKKESIAVIHRAIELGVTLLDTALCDRMYPMKPMFKHWYRKRHDLRQTR